MLKELIKNNNNWKNMNEKNLIPLSILVAGIFIGLSIYLTSDEKTPVVIEKNNEEKKEITAKRVDTLNDHILGNKDAEVFLVEYSDLECSFCKNYNKNVIKKLQQKYKDNEKLAFVFRHFPLTSKHPSSFEQAVSLECAAKLGGEKKFFEFKEKIFSETASDGHFSSSRLSEISQELGLKKDDFDTCLKNPNSIKKVTDSYNEAISIGLTSTPSVFIQLKSGETYSIPADYEVTKNLIEAYFSEKK